ncbi:hypothetical protein NMY22_g19167 [Coprinellus aureogranulatus]|nr:hypothetical protein NMY22_g19167 [Coprinellus aureogranulatus]
MPVSDSRDLLSHPDPPVPRAFKFTLPPLERPNRYSLHGPAITSQMPNDLAAPVVDAGNETIIVDGAPLVLSGSDSGSTDSHDNTSATMSSCTISDTEPQPSDQHNLSPPQDMDADILSYRCFSPGAIEDDDDATLYIDIAEDEAIQKAHSERYFGDIKHRNCDCTCSRHFTSCQLVQRLRMSCARDWAGALRHYGIDGYESVKQLARVPQSVLLKQFDELIRFVEGGKLAQATILAFSVRRVRGKEIDCGLADVLNRCYILYSTTTSRFANPCKSSVVDPIERCTDVKHKIYLLYPLGPSIARLCPQVGIYDVIQTFRGGRLLLQISKLRISATRLLNSPVDETKPSPEGKDVVQNVPVMIKTASLRPSRRTPTTPSRHALPRRPLNGSRLIGSQKFAFHTHSVNSKSLKDYARAASPSY